MDKYLRCVIWALLAFGASLNAQEETCKNCHGDRTAGRVHAALNQSCSSCHGSGEEHIARPTGGGIINFSDESKQTRSAACTTCHAALPVDGIGAHNAAGLACNDCHSIHDNPDNSTAASFMDSFTQLGIGSRTCVRCHEELLAEFNFSDRHRLREGSMSCSSCHDPHGAAENSHLNFDASATCNQCHAAQDGPFVFEHAASRVEGCTACHAPHGGQNRHLLTHQDVGELCYSCHVTVPQFHLGFAPGGSPRFGLDTVCTNCHVTIHGSNVDPNFLQ